MSAAAELMQQNAVCPNMFQSTDTTGDSQTNENQGYRCERQTTMYKGLLTLNVLSSQNKWTEVHVELGSGTLCPLLFGPTQTWDAVCCCLVHVWCSKSAQKNFLEPLFSSHEPQQVTAGVPLKTNALMPPNPSLHCPVR